jgi:hypothetical protein
MQFKNPWNNNSRSPTVSQASVNITIGITAFKDNDIESIDITGAFLHADTKDDKEIVQLSKDETTILIELYPKFQQYVQQNGTILMTVDKALYGMVNSARDWYDNISNTLTKNGYLKNPVDECVFSYTDKNNNQSIIDLWVDDLLHSYTKNCIELRDRLRNILKNKYKNINVKEGNSIPYCGMLLEKDLKNGGIFISAPKFIDDLLKVEGVKDTATSPSTQSFLKSNLVNKFNIKIDQTKYASKLMKLMWIARLCRHDILFQITYLSTKTNNATTEDMNKLDHVLKYLNNTKDLKMKIKPTSLQLNASIDASHALHEDAKGQSGIIIMLGNTGPPVFCKSRKQKLVSRSSCESELIALNEFLPELEWARQFMIGLGFQQETSTVFQDNKASIILSNRSPGSTIGRTKHIQIRFFYVKQLIEQQKIKIEYLPTEEMLADILTKPLYGRLFYKLRGLILNSN